ncbi:MAG TPA: 5-methyltetrahydropteroyltriglutamate--homocysteine S-methyltransferase [Xanthobacteraceae bacterium]|nr:5-methyltetrahydropteroyltriglutamate--homocysteine S-methyltransferase [Xanthobacteraceae bacterium]
MASPQTFRADHVGSFIRPDNLIKAREDAQKNAISKDELEKIQHDAIKEIVKIQEDLGLKVTTDGEFNRASWQRDFLVGFTNVSVVPSKIAVKFHTKDGARENAPPTLAVTGKLGRAAPIFVDDFKFLKSITKETPKVTFPSPTVLHFRGGRQVVDEKAYPDIQDFYDDLARVYREEIADLAGNGCRYIQIDEVNLAYLCDPALRGQVQGFGEDPDALLKTYAKLLNDVVKDKPSDMIAAMHLCRGNFAGAWVAEGGYDPIAEVLFNDINIDRYFLEYDSERAGGFEPLRFLPKGKTAVLGLVTTKSADMETKDDLKRRIDEAAKFAPLEQLALSPQCGFSSGIGGNTMDVKREVEKLKLVVETARDVWGTA